MSFPIFISFLSFPLSCPHSSCFLPPLSSFFHSFNLSFPWFISLIFIFFHFSFISFFITFSFYFPPFLLSFPISSFFLSLFVPFSFLLPFFVSLLPLAVFPVFLSFSLRCPFVPFTPCFLIYLFWFLFLSFLCFSRPQSFLPFCISFLFIFPFLCLKLFLLFFSFFFLSFLPCFLCPPSFFFNSSFLSEFFPSLFPCLLVLSVLHNKVGPLLKGVLVHFYIAVLPPTVTHKLLRWRNTVHNHTLRTALPLCALCRWGMTSVIQGANQAFMMKPRQRAAAEVRVTQWCHACGFIIPAAPRCWLIDCETAATCIYRFGIKASSILLNTKWFDVEESSLPLIEVTVTWLTTFLLIGKINEASGVRTRSLSCERWLPSFTKHGAALHSRLWNRET